MSKTDTVGRHKTTIGAEDGTTYVRYHSTKVVKWTPEKLVTLNSGGWRTVTTKLRMNQASRQFDLGFQVYQRDFSWYVDVKGETLPFEDGMVF